MRDRTYSCHGSTAVYDRIDRERRRRSDSRLYPLSRSTYSIRGSPNLLPPDEVVPARQKAVCYAPPRSEATPPTPWEAIRFGPGAGAESNLCPWTWLSRYARKLPSVPRPNGAHRPESAASYKATRAV